MASIKTVSSWDTEHSADSVEWCPLFPCQDHFICGTYQLELAQGNAGAAALQEGQQQKKLGRLYLLKLNSSKSIEVLQVIEMPAVLDCKWCHKKIQGKILLCVANEVGEVHLYELKVNEERYEDREESWKYQLYVIAKISVCPLGSKGILALSIDWSTGRSSDNPALCVSDSKGNITLAELDSNTIEITQQWKAHSAEAWITAFDYWNTHIVYTGGDDCKFHTFDVRCGVSQPSATSRSHDTGVTSLHCNSLHQHMLASGSYDEKVRLWDTRNTRQPISAVIAGGGVWRVKWDPYIGDHIVAACIYGGFCIIHHEHNTLQLCCKYQGEHKSLGYGADWCHAPQSRESVLIGTCSFYDHRLCVAAVMLENNCWSTEKWSVICDNLPVGSTTV